MTKESQGITKERDSIQFRVISILRNRNYDIIYDDGSGEAADVVTIQVIDQEGRKIINIEFYHCKFSRGKPGQRVEDLYAVCGQAQKSVYWMYSTDKQVDLLSHFLRREPERKKGAEASRFAKGNQDLLIEIREMSRISTVNLRVFVVQPGLQKSKASFQQLELLSVTENYLMETYKLHLGVIASP